MEFVFHKLCNKMVVCETNAANIFGGIAIYFSSKYGLGSSSASQPSDFSPAMDKQKTILRNGALFSACPSPTKNHKTTIIPALSLKNRCSCGGDDRQVSQNGMPFCTGCTLSGHILNLPEGLRPLGTPI